MASRLASVHTPLTVDDFLDLLATATFLQVEHGVAPVTALEYAAMRFRDARASGCDFIEPNLIGSTTEGAAP